jgi:hypothetical protein
MPTPRGDRGAADDLHADDGTSACSLTAAAPQAQRCAGCGAAGHPPTIVWDQVQAPPGVVLVPVFGWHPDGRPALLCPNCKRNLTKRRGRARYSKTRPSDGHMTEGRS